MAGSNKLVGGNDFTVMALQVWKTIGRRYCHSYDLTKYLNDLKQFKAKGDWIQSLQLLETLEKDGVKMNLKMYTYAIESCLKEEKFPVVVGLYNNMKNDEIQIEYDVEQDNFIETLLEAFAHCEEHDKSRELFNAVEFPIRSIMRLKQVIASCGYEGDVETMLKAIVKSEFKQRNESFANVFGSVVKFCGVTNQVEYIAPLLAIMEDKGARMNANVFNHVCFSYLKCGAVEHANNLLESEMKFQLRNNVGQLAVLNLFQEKKYGTLHRLLTEDTIDYSGLNTFAKLKLIAGCLAHDMESKKGLLRLEELCNDEKALGDFHVAKFHYTILAFAKMGLGDKMDVLFELILDQKDLKDVPWEVKMSYFRFLGIGNSEVVHRETLKLIDLARRNPNIQEHKEKLKDLLILCSQSSNVPENIVHEFYNAVRELYPIDNAEDSYYARNELVRICASYGFSDMVQQLFQDCVEAQHACDDDNIVGKTFSFAMEGYESVEQWGELRNCHEQFLEHAQANPNIILSVRGHTSWLAAMLFQNRESGSLNKMIKTVKQYITTNTINSDKLIYKLIKLGMFKETSALLKRKATLSNQMTHIKSISNAMELLKDTSESNLALLLADVIRKANRTKKIPTLAQDISTCIQVCFNDELFHRIARPYYYLVNRSIEPNNRAKRCIVIASYIVNRLTDCINIFESLSRTDQSLLLRDDITFSIIVRAYFKSKQYQEVCDIWNLHRPEGDSISITGPVYQKSIRAAELVSDKRLESVLNEKYHSHHADVPSSELTSRTEENSAVKPLTSEGIELVLSELNAINVTKMLPLVLSYVNDNYHLPLDVLENVFNNLIASEELSGICPIPMINHLLETVSKSNPNLLSRSDTLAESIRNLILFKLNQPDATSKHHAYRLYANCVDLQYEIADKESIPIFVDMLLENNALMKLDNVFKSRNKNNLLATIPVEQLSRIILAHHDAKKHIALLNVVTRFGKVSKRKAILLQDKEIIFPIVSSAYHLSKHSFVQELISEYINPNANLIAFILETHFSTKGDLEGIQLLSYLVKRGLHIDANTIEKYMSRMNLKDSQVFTQHEKYDLMQIHDIRHLFSESNEYSQN